MFPTLSQYNKAIQNLDSSTFSSLDNLSFIPAKTLPIKIYNFGSGSFAVVFKAIENNKEIAIRCFIGSDNDYVERYRKINTYLSSIDESWKTNIKFLENEIKVEGKYYPVLKMDWVDGKLLNKYIDNNLYNNDVLSKLQKQFVKISNNLEINRIAHGDIQCGNIIVQEINNKIKVKLIDYDGLYIPYFSGERQKERGRSEFQHPHRSSFSFNEKIDRFSFWVMLCALEALKFDKTLWKETMQGGFNTLDNILFVGSDFSNPNHSKLFQRISNINQPSLNFYIAKLHLSLNTSNIEKLSFYGQENSLNYDLKDESNNENEKIIKENPSKENNTNQYARLKITSSPSGASVRNKDFEIIGNTPFIVNKYDYVNQEIKIISGTKSISRNIYEFSSDIHITFEEPVYKNPEFKSTNPNPPVIPASPPDKDLAFRNFIIFVIISVVVGFFIYSNNKKSTKDDSLEFSNIDTTAVAVDTTAVAVDTALTFVDTSAVAEVNPDAEPTEISNSNSIDVASNLYRAYFIGRWRDEYSSFVIYANGDYYIKYDGGIEKWTKWEYYNGKLYFGTGNNNSMIREFIISNEANSFIYREDGDTTNYYAYRTGN